MTRPDCYIGLISGTSVDAVDAVVCRFDPKTGHPEILAKHSHPPEPALRDALLALSERGRRLSLAEFGRLDQSVGAWFAEAAINAMQKASTSSHDIRAIGSHGQTVWHAPDEPPAFSLQIGAAPRIAAITGCDVVTDFRNADIALGGQGAPLVCAFHTALFGHTARNRVVVNIGGIANLTVLPAGSASDLATVTGFDTGPGNGLMDAWIAREFGESYDANGAWAASGRVDHALLARLRNDTYFDRRPPKSTGREHFGLAWLDRQLAQHGQRASPADIQATLCELTACSIVDAIKTLGPGDEQIYLCGGGVYNAHLCARISALAAPRSVSTTDALGLKPDWIEALAFAWLARQRVLGRPGNAPGVTGASGPAILGGWHAAPTPSGSF